MPFTAADAKKHTKGLNPSQEEAWAKIANRALADCEKKNQGDCEGRAIRIANAQAKRVGESIEAALTAALSEQIDLAIGSTEEIREAFSRGQVFGEARVDRTSNLLSNVVMLGKVSANGRIYSDRALNDAVRLYEGAGFYIDHPLQSEMRDRKGVRSVHDLAGCVKNPRRVGESVRGDIELLDREPHKSLIFALAEQMPTMVGSSHRAEGTVRHDNGQQIVESLDKVYGVELVTDPATVNGLFESIQNEDDEMKDLTLEQLKTQRPDLVKAVLAESKEQGEVERLKAENADLKKKNEVHEAKDKERDHQAMVAKKLEEAKLPDRFVSDGWKQQLDEAKDEKAVDALIAERKELLQSMSDSSPKSFEREFKTGGDKKAMDATAIERWHDRVGVA